jgi:copper transport protein
MLALAALLRWWTLAATALVAGGLVLHALVPAAADEARDGRRRLRSWVALGVLALMTAWFGELLLRAQTMTMGTFGAAWSAIPTVLARTQFGTMWTIRAVCVAALLPASLATATAVRVAAMPLTLVVMFTTSLTGHAADSGVRSLDVLADGVHLTAAAVWVGGLVGLIGALRGVARWPGPLVATLAQRFSRLAGACVLAVVVSGGYTAWRQLSAVSDVWMTPYGRILGIKLALVAVLLALGAVSRYVALSALVPSAPGTLTDRLAGVARRLAGTPARGRAPAYFVRCVARELVVAVLVLAATAVLAETTPARHARHLRMSYADVRR